MQKIYSHIIGTPVCRIQDGEVLALVTGLVIDTDKGKIEGLWVRTAEFFGHKKILLIQDIREWKLKIYIDDEASFSDPEDLIRLEDILEHNITLYNKRVLTTSDIYVGRVYDYTFEVDTYRLLNFFIVKRFLFFTLQRRIVPLKEVVEINEDAIIIRSDLKLAKWRKKKIINLNNFVFTPEPDPNAAIKKET